MHSRINPIIHPRSARGKYPSNTPGSIFICCSSMKKQRNGIIMRPLEQIRGLRSSPGLDMIPGPGPKPMPAWRCLHRLRCLRRSPGLEPTMAAKPHTVFNNWIKLSVERMTWLDSIRFTGISVVDDWTTQDDLGESPRSYVRSKSANIKSDEYPIHTTS